MTPEPKKPIEDLLEASAKARRAEFGADAKMPNPMRARLHEEIARMGREESDQAERGRGFSIWWPRIALAAAAAVLLLGTPILWLRHTSHSGGETLGLATREVDSMKAPSSRASSDIEPALADGKAAKMEQPAQPASAPLADAAVASPSSLGGSFAKAETDKMTTAGENKATERDENALKKFADVTIAPAESAKAKNFNSEERLAKKSVAAASAPAAGALAPGRKMEAANFKQQFAQNSANQSARFSAKLKQAVSVLNTFQIEQDGTRIRVVDADGSTYTGKIEALAQNDSRNLSRQQQIYAAQRSKDDENSGGPEFYFHATGYNGSLKKRLVFEGNYIMTAPQQAMKRGMETDSVQSKEQAPARIVGTAKISGEAPVAVDAVAVTP